MSKSIISHPPCKPPSRDIRFNRLIYGYNEATPLTYAEGLAVHCRIPSWISALHVDHLLWTSWTIFFIRYKTEFYYSRIQFARIARIIMEQCAVLTPQTQQNALNSLPIRIEFVHLTKRWSFPTFTLIRDFLLIKPSVFLQKLLFVMCMEIWIFICGLLMPSR